MDYSRFEGALSGYLTSELANINAVSVSQNVNFMNKEADILIERFTRNIVIDIKFAGSKEGISKLVENSISRATHYLQDTSVIGIAILIYTQNEEDYAVSVLADSQEAVRLVAPKSAGRLLARYRLVRNAF
jgi:hypothetical protein